MIRFTKFAGVGAIGTAAHYLLLLLSVSAFNLPPVAGSTIGAFFGALTNYWLNRSLTFQSKRAHAEALPRFLAMAGASLTLNALALWLLVAAGLHYFLAQMIATVIILVFNYLVASAWIFHRTGS